MFADPFRVQHVVRHLSPADDELKIRCFGALAVERAGRPVCFPTRRAKLLFAYLVLHRERPRLRDVVLGTFWGDEPDAAARKYLRTELWRLRRCLEPCGTPRGTYLHIGSDEIGFNTASPYWLDIEAFEGRIRDAGAEPGERITAEQTHGLEEAVELYRGDLCEDVYDDWAVYERERLKQLFCGALERLMAQHGARADWNRAISCGQRLLSRDPLREHVHRELMRFHYAKGDRPAALRQYQECTAYLRRELGVDPMPETLGLYDVMRSGRAQPPHVTWERRRRDVLEAVPGRGGGDPA
jgi:DNA-binding SARP family transcriptional activator